MCVQSRFALSLVLRATSAVCLIIALALAGSTADSQSLYGDSTATGTIFSIGAGAGNLIPYVTLSPALSPTPKDSCSTALVISMLAGTAQSSR